MSNPRRASESIVLCRDLYVTAGGQPIVRGATIRVEPRTVTVLVGESGIGKTVLAEVIFGLRGRSDDDGVRRVAGGVRRVAGEVGSAASEGALVFQEGKGIGHLTVLQNLSLVRRNDESNQRLLARLGLDPDQLARFLSVGQGRRLAVAQGIAAGRRLLWVDEPAAGLDLRRADALARILREQAKEGAAVLVTSHQPELIVRLGAEKLLFLGRDRKLHPAEPPPAGGAAEIADHLRRLMEPPSDLDSADGEDATEDLREREAEPRPRPWLSKAFDALYHVTYEAWIGLKSLAWAVPEQGWDVRAMRQEALRLAAREGATFYVLVGAIFALVFVLALEIAIEPLLSTTKVLVKYGPILVVRFSPAMAGILVAARAGASISAWIGQLTFRRQFDALRLLRGGLEERLVGPVWIGLLIGGLAGTFLFGASLTAVFCAYLALAASDAKALELLSNFETQRIVMAALKTLFFAAVISAVTLACARRPKRRVEDVASHLTRGIVISTVLVMAFEALFLATEWRLEDLE